jgi:hypothetical protein
MGRVWHPSNSHSLAKTLTSPSCLCVVQKRFLTRSPRLPKLKLGPAACLPRIAAIELAHLTPVTLTWPSSLCGPQKRLARSTGLPPKIGNFSRSRRDLASLGHNVDLARLLVRSIEPLRSAPSNSQPKLAVVSQPSKSHSWLPLLSPIAAPCVHWPRSGAPAGGQCVRSTAVLRALATAAP